MIVRGESVRARLALVLLSAAWVGAQVVGCDNAFRSRTVASEAPPFTVSFEGGGDTLAIVEGAPVTIVLEVPPSGFQRLFPIGPDTVDPARLLISVDRDFGDPAHGGIPAGTSITVFLDALGWIAIEHPSGLAALIRVTLDTAAPFPFPAGFMNFHITVLDDGDVVHGPFTIELAVQALDRPTLLVRLETPPPGSIPTGQPLPLDDDGVPFVGEYLPFVLSLQAIPNPQSGEGFTLLFGPGGIDPARLTLIADHDLGDGSSGGFFAGDNLASIVATDLDFTVDSTGGFLTGALFIENAPYSPALGDTVFRAVVLDDAGVASSEQVVTLRAEPPVTLSGDVQPLYNATCIFCHLPPFPESDLELFEDAFGSTVGVRAVETPDDSCALLRVAPYDADASYLLQKVLGMHLGGCVNGAGDAMPYLAPPWTDEEKALLERWIEQGAHDH